MAAANPTGNIMCSICTENYKPTDAVYATGCGHVYHENCMQEWKGRAGTCPQCRTPNPTIIKLFLTFEDATERETKLGEVKSQLENTVCNVSVLQYELDESKRNFQELQGLLSKYDDDLKKSREENECLIIQNEGWQQEIATLKASKHNHDAIVASLNGELQRLKNGQGPSFNNVVNDVALQEKIKVLEEKLKQVNLELQKEIKNTTKLTVEKMRLKCMLDAQAKDNVPTAAVADMPATITVPTTTIKQQTDNECSKGRNPFENNIPIMEAKTDAEKTSNATVPIVNAETEMMPTKVVIRNLSAAQFTLPLPLLVLHLAHQMGLTDFAPADIAETSILENKYQQRQNHRQPKSTLLVKFATLDKKIQFLSNKQKLAQNPATKELSVKEYVTEDVLQLFHHANSLRHCGYWSIYCTNNMVYVKRYKNSVPVRITSQAQVDEMKTGTLHQQIQNLQQQMINLDMTNARNTQMNNNNKDTGANCDDDDSCDENYYLKI